MQFQSIEGLAFQEKDPKYRKCGTYVKQHRQIKVRPNTYIMMPLKHIDYNIEINNSLSSVTLQQTYYNPTQKFLEVEFSFPIDPKSCIYKFVAQFGDKRIQGIVKEKQQAKKQYKQAIKQGKQAVYAQIDTDSSDIMNLQIGNIAPETEVKISISYLQQLSIIQNTFYQLHLTSTISPRCMEQRKGRRVNYNWTDKQHPQLVKNVTGQYTWSFKITLATTRKLTYHKSPTHKLQMLSSNQAENQKIFVLPNQELPNKDLNFLFTTQNFHLPSYVLGRTDVSSTAMISFIPKFCELSVDDAYRASLDNKTLDSDIDAAKGEYIFLLDRSGSMRGQRIENAKKALLIFLKSLPENTYFNVVSFGRSKSLLFHDSVKYSSENLNKAVREVQKMKADMGGTQIYNPLEVIYNKKTIQGYPKQIFLLTDGAVSNTDRVIGLVERRTKYSRCHSIGIGNGCSQALIKGCAEKGKGKFVFIADSDDPSDKIIQLLEQTLTPVIDSVKLEFDKSIVESVVPNPNSIPYVLKNEVINFYITFKGQLDTKANFIFGYQDSLNKTPFKSTIQVNPDSESVAFVDKMAHFKIIKNLQYSAKNNEPLQELMYYVKIKDYKKEAISHSIKHQILSEYTAFICVAKQLIDGQYQEIKDKGQQKVHIQNVLPEEYQNIKADNREASYQRTNKIKKKCKQVESKSRKLESSSITMDCFDSLKSNFQFNSYKSPPLQKQQLSFAAKKQQVLRSQRPSTTTASNVQRKKVSKFMEQQTKLKPQKKQMPKKPVQKRKSKARQQQDLLDFHFNNKQSNKKQKFQDLLQMNQPKSVKEPQSQYFKPTILKDKEQCQKRSFSNLISAQMPNSIPMQTPLNRPVQNQQIQNDLFGLQSQLQSNMKIQNSENNNLIELDNQSNNLSQQNTEKCQEVDYFSLEKEAFNVKLIKQEIHENNNNNKNHSISINSEATSLKSCATNSKIEIEEVLKYQNIDGGFSNQYLLDKMFSFGANQKQLIHNLSKTHSLEVIITYLVVNWIEKFYPRKQYKLIIKKAISLVKKTVNLNDLSVLSQLFN